MYPFPSRSDPTLTLGSLWRHWRKPGVICIRSSGYVYTYIPTSSNYPEIVIHRLRHITFMYGNLFFQQQTNKDGNLFFSATNKQRYVFRFDPILVFSTFSVCLISRFSFSNSFFKTNSRRETKRRTICR